MGFLYLLLPLVLLVSGFPIYLILLVTSLAVITLIQHVEPGILLTQVFGGLDNPPLLAIPFFILAGEIMGQGGIARRLVAWVLSIIGGVRGSLGLTTIASAELFGAMSGSSVGCVAAIGRLLHPSLRSYGYDERFSIGIVASSGAIASIIPPSISMIIYGVTANASVPKLFIAGIIPGLLIGTICATYVIFYSRTHKIAVEPRRSWGDVLHTTRDAVWSIGAPTLIFGGIYGGICTPTEAAGVAAIYAALVSVYVYHDVTWSDLWRIARNSTYLIAQILIIVAAADVYSKLLTTSGIPQQMIAGLTEFSLQPWMLLLIFNIILLLFGSFLEPPAAILVLTPLVLPIIKEFGIDEIQFGIIVTVNLSIGMFLPPFGLNLFAAHALFNVPLTTIYRGAIPFVLLNIVALVLITYIPALSLILLR